MPSFAGLYSPLIRLRIALAGIAFAAIALSLLLAFASVSVRLPSTPVRRTAVTIAPTPALHSTASMIAPNNAIKENQSPQLWRLLVPWAFTVDAIALVGLVVALRMLRR